MPIKRNKFKSDSDSSSNLSSSSESSFEAQDKSPYNRNRLKTDRVRKRKPRCRLDAMGYAATILNAEGPRKSLNAEEDLYKKNKGDSEGKAYSKCSVAKCKCSNEKVPPDIKDCALRKQLRSFEPLELEESDDDFESKVKLFRKIKKTGNFKKLDEQNMNIPNQRRSNTESMGKRSEMLDEYTSQKSKRQSFGRLNRYSVGERNSFEKKKSFEAGELISSPKNYKTLATCPDRSCNAYENSFMEQENGKSNKYSFIPNPSSTLETRTSQSRMNGEAKKLFFKQRESQMLPNGLSNARIENVETAKRRRFAGTKMKPSSSNKIQLETTMLPQDESAEELNEPPVISWCTRIIFGCFGFCLSISIYIYAHYDLIFDTAAKHPVHRPR